MRKTIVFILVLAVLAGGAPRAVAAGPALDCGGAVLIDGVGGGLLYEVNSDVRHYPASVTKIMTLLLILEGLEREEFALDDLVTVSAEAAAMGGSQVYLYAGEQRTVEDMLIAIAVGSGNDAAYAMAEFVGGSLEGFVTLMNRRGQELGMTNTHFVNPHGLHDPEHYTTAADLGKLAYCALRTPGFLDYTSIYEYDFRPEPNLLTLWNTNRLLKWYEGTDGMKTGYTEEAGRNLVASVEREGTRLISVVLGCRERQGHFKESMTLLNYGFNNFTYQEIFPAGEIVAEIPVSKGAADRVGLAVAESVGYIQAKGEAGEYTTKIQAEGVLDAPVAAGQSGGQLLVYKDGQLWLTYELQAVTAVERGGFARTWKKLLGMMW